MGLRLPQHDAERLVARPDGDASDAVPQDHTPSTRIHRMVLQHVQYTRPRSDWVLKGFHGRRLRALFDTYPDARHHLGAP